MQIEGNQKELDAMKAFHEGNRAEGLKLQEEFAARVQGSIQRERPLSLSESMQISWKLQRMCCDT